MGMVCPQCATNHEGRLQCPLCGTRLLFHDPRRLPSHSPVGAVRWQQRPWGRILIGLLLAQGLFYGLRHLLTGVLLAAEGGDAAQQMWSAGTGFLLLQGVGIVALLAGAVLAGVGQRQGLVLGAVVGAWNGVLSVLYLPGPVQALSVVALLGQPLLQAVVGAVGGWLGSRFWRPIAAEASPVLPAKSPRDVRRRPSELFTGPVARVRVTLGVLLAVVGTLTATIFFEKIMDVSHGALATTDDTEDRLITLEIKALALFLGGAFAGATTRNGVKQGLCVGVLTAVILVGVEINFVVRWLEVAGLTLVCSLCLGTTGGWFGSQLFPPVVRVRRSRGVGSAP